MKLHELKPRANSQSARKRVGRGIAAGQGKTAGRGTKGQGARSGSGGNLYRQGGNLPFFRRLPFKRGFTNINRIRWSEVNLSWLAEFEEGSQITPELLYEEGIIDKRDRPVVVIGREKLKSALIIKVHRITSGARESVEKAGGKVQLLER